jgi:hypothetical protein
MSTHYSSTTNHVSMAPRVAESIIAAKRSELRTLWDEIRAGDPSSSIESQSRAIDDPTTQLHQLVEELQSMDHKSPPAYIERLPDELLYTVFLLTLSLCSDVWDQNRINRFRFHTLNLDFAAWAKGGSLTLSMVCKRWQTVMLSSSPLWSNLIIDAEGLEPEHLQFYLHLSCDHPLTLYIIAPNKDTLLALKPHAHRVQHLYDLTNGQICFETLDDDATMVVDHAPSRTTLRIPTSSILSLNISPKKSPLESVCHFQHLQQLSIWSMVNDLTFVPENVSIPCLRILTLDRIEGEGSTSVLRRFPVQKLQVLSLDFSMAMSYKEFTSLQSYIYQMPSLISVGLGIRPSNQGWVENPPPPDLFSSTIRQVELNCLDEVNTPFQFVAGIRSLERLVLRGHSQQGSLECWLPATLRELVLDMDGDHIQEMQEISLPSLETLKLRVPFSVAYGDSLLRKFFAPSLIRLEILGIRSILSVEDLSISLTHATFTHIPRAQHLYIQGVDITGSVPSFPQLRTLHIWTHDWMVLTSLDAPQLSELTVLITRMSVQSKRGVILKEDEDTPGKHQPTTSWIPAKSHV